MIVYLVQHGEANPEAVDPDRDLSPKGIDEVNRVGAYAAKLNLPVERIWHSGKTRAAHTASLLAGHLLNEKAVEKAEGLSPNDNPALWVQRLNSIDENVMLVGHLPHLSRLSTLLLCGTEEKVVINFYMGAIVCLRRTDGHWGVDWVLTPEVVLE